MYMYVHAYRYGYLHQNWWVQCLTPNSSMRLVASQNLQEPTGYHLLYAEACKPSYYTCPIRRFILLRSWVTSSRIHEGVKRIFAFRTLSCGAGFEVEATEANACATTTPAKCTTTHTHLLCPSILAYIYTCLNHVSVSLHTHMHACTHARLHDVPNTHSLTHTPHVLQTFNRQPKTTAVLTGTQLLSMSFSISCVMPFAASPCSTVNPISEFSTKIRVVH